MVSKNLSTISSVFRRGISISLLSNWTRSNLFMLATPFFLFFLVRSSFGISLTVVVIESTLHSNLILPVFKASDWTSFNWHRISVFTFCTYCDCGTLLYLKQKWPQLCNLLFKLFSFLFQSKGPSICPAEIVFVHGCGLRASPCCRVLEVSPLPKEILGA